MFVEGYDMSKVDTLQWIANKLLASKAPEMAELLISLIKAVDSLYHPFLPKSSLWAKVEVQIENIADDAEELLKEIGHEAPTEASPKE